MDESAENLIPPPDTGEVLELCRAVARAGGLLAAHCEDRGVIDGAERDLGHPITSYAELLQARPDTAEAVSIAIATELCAATRCRLNVVHTASRSGIHANQARAARRTAVDRRDVPALSICPLKPRGYHLGPANDLVAQAAARQRRFIPLARIDPNLGDDALSELDRALGGLNARGLFLHPWEENFRINSVIVDPLIARCAAAQVPVVIATGYPWVSEAAQVGDLARRFPEVPMLMTHGGQINISGLGQFDALQVLQRHANVAIETSGVYRQDFLQDVARDLGSERVLFGSNSPRMDVRLEIARVRWAKLADAARQRILAENARRFFKWSSSAPQS